MASDGAGSVLYGILLIAQTGDECFRGVGYFFDGERLVTNTGQLPPDDLGGGVVSLATSGPSSFAVGYAVSPSVSTSCADNGSAGTDTYTYGWSDAEFVVLSGVLPNPPSVLVGA